MRILLVDDNKDWLDLVESDLVPRHEVVKVNCPEEAITTFENSEFDLLVSDYEMEPIKGTELITHFKKRHPNRQAILLTAFSSKDIAVSAIRAGADEYIEKPINQDLFDASFKRIEKMHKLEETNRNLVEQLMLLNTKLAMSNQKLSVEIDERKKAEEDAVEASQIKSKYVSVLSHELKTPLNSIMGFAKFIQWHHDDDPLSEQQSQAFGQILTSSELLNELVNQVLDMERIFARENEITLAPVNFTDVLKDCIDIVSHMCDQNNISITYLNEGQEFPYLIADRVALQRVLLNLLSNAIKYNCKDGKVNISIAHANNTARICVQDTGLGIPKARAAELFQPFSRLGRDQTSIEGTGIGLVIIKELINQMGGTLSYESSEGVGSSFWFTIPLMETKSS